MKKKLSLVLLIVLLSLQLSACTDVAVNNNMTGKVVSPGNTDKKPEISIIVLRDQAVNDMDFFSSYTRQFEREYGVTVNCITVDGRNKDDYYEKLLVMLNKKDGAELILYQWYDMSALVREKAVVDLRGKVPNLDKVYDSLLKEEVYYVPVGMSCMGMALNRKVLEALNISEHNFDWTKHEYYTIRDKWLAEAKRPFTRDEFYYSFNKHSYKLQIIDNENKKASINTKEMKELIRNVRNDIFSGNYRLNKNYTYKNYYNLLFDEQSEEYKEGWTYLLSNEYSDSSLRNMDKEGFCNILVSENNDYMLKWNNLAVLPWYKDPFDLEAWGFLVNRNGKEQELACEFINGFLSDEVQLQLLNKPTGIFCYYPVSKAVESDIKDMEKKKQLGTRAVELKEYAVDKVKRGKINVDFYMDEGTNGKESKMMESVLKDITKYIFADKLYFDEELSKELQALEDKYNIWLNE